MVGDYLQNSVETEDPLELVCLLYAKAIERIKAASEHLNRGEIRERAQAIALASQIVLELQSALDADKGGEIAVNLARVYDFVQEQLAEANAQRKLEPLEVSLRLLETLHEGWQDCRAERRSASAESKSPTTVPTSQTTEEVDDFSEAVAVGSGPARAWTL
jgi:flagellar protein FliS